MFKLTFVTPDRKLVVNEELESITLPAFKGELNILPGHAPLMTTLEAGIARYKLKNGTSDKLAISWGYCQISSEGVNVLAESAVHSDEIDIEVIKQHLKRDEQRLIAESLDDQEWLKVQNDTARLRAEINLYKENTK